MGSMVKKQNHGAGVLTGRRQTHLLNIYVPFTSGNVAHTKRSHKPTSMDVIKCKMVDLQKVIKQSHKHKTSRHNITTSILFMSQGNISDLSTYISMNTFLLL